MKKILVLLFTLFCGVVYAQLPDTVHYGSAPDAGDGDSVRRAFIITNGNFTFLDGRDHEQGDTLLWVIDTTEALRTDVDLKVNILDTAAIFAPFIERGDTATIFTPFIERGDTAAMLLTYALLDESNLDYYFIAANDASAREKAIADAICDGTADQVEINAAITAGYNVRLSSGTFNIAAPITAAVDNAIISGSNTKTTIINLSNGANCNVITQGGNYWEIKNLTINGNDDNNTGTCYGIYNIRKKGLTIDNIELYAVEDDAVSLRDSANTVNVKNSYFHDTGGAGVYGIRLADYPAEIGDGPYNVTIDNCRFHNTGSGADVGCLNYSTADYTAHDWNVMNSKFTGYVGYMGIYYVNGYSLNAYNNYFELDSALGVSSPACIRYFNEAQGVVDGNTFRSTGYDGHALISIINSNNIVISNNDFTSTHVGATHGLHIESVFDAAGSFNVYNINITGNNFYNVGNLSDARAIVLYSENPYTISHVNINDNIFLDDRGASALTTSGVFVNSDGCSKVNITGNIAEGMLEDFVRFTNGSAAISDFIIANNLIVDIPTGIRAEIGNDLQILGNRFVSCTTPININDADVTRAMVTNNNWYGCTNDASIASATTPIINNNIDKDGIWYSNINPPLAADAQANDDYEVSIPAVSALYSGLTVTFTANTLNTEGATLEITEMGDLDAILKNGDTALATGDIVAGQVVVVVFDGSNWQMISQLAQ